MDLLSFSLVWRDRRFTKVNATAYLKLWNYHESGDATVPKLVEQRHTLALDFEPMEVMLSAGIKLKNFNAQASVTWNHWSDYLDTHHQRAQYTAVADPVPGATSDPDYEFSDTFSVSLGVSWEYLEGFTLLGGASYRPTPVPPQTGRTNYVDNDLLSLAVGHRFAFSLWGRNFIADVHVAQSNSLPFKRDFLPIRILRDIQSRGLAARAVDGCQRAARAPRGVLHNCNG